MDHMNDKNVKSLEFQWMSEYAKEYGSNILPKQALPAQLVSSVATATTLIPTTQTGAQTSVNATAPEPISTANTASMAVPLAVNDFAQTFSKPGVSDTASLALPPPSTNVSAQTSPVKIVAGVRFGGLESTEVKSINSSTNQSVSAQSSSVPKNQTDTAAMAIPASTTTSQQTSPAKEVPASLPSFSQTAKKTAVDTSAMAIPQSTTTSQQTSPVKKALTQSTAILTSAVPSISTSASTVSKQVVKKTGGIVQPKPLKTPTAPLSPRMAQYGQGNTYNPSTPSLYMKTHNVRAPQDEVYPHTLSQKARVAEYDRETLTPHPPTQPAATLPSPTQILHEYKKAAHLVATVQLHFKSEYKRAFINWSRPWSQIKKELEGNVSGPLATIDAERLVVDPVDVRVAGLASGLAGRDKSQPATMGARVQSAGPVPAPIAVARRKIGGGLDKNPVDFTRVQSIYQSLKSQKKQ